jgi:hypothetical protein
MRATDIPLGCGGGTIEDTAREAGSSKLASQVLQVLADLGFDVEGIALPVTIHRTRAGHHQRSAGAWSWWLSAADGREIVGCHDPASMAIAAHQDGALSILEAALGAPSLDVENQWWLAYDAKRMAKTKEEP